AILLRQPLQVLTVVLIVMIGKSLGAFFIVLLFRYPVRTALTISASLAQIGEFSFILAALAVALHLLPPEGQGLIVAGALLSISLNPVAFWAASRANRWIVAGPPRAPRRCDPPGGPPPSRHRPCPSSRRCHPRSVPDAGHCRAGAISQPCHRHRRSCSQRGRADLPRAPRCSTGPHR